MLKKRPLKNKNPTQTSHAPRNRITALLKSRPISPKKQLNNEKADKAPRTCFESPNNLIGFQPNNRRGSCEVQPTKQKITIKGIIKVSHYPAKNRVIKSTYQDNLQKLAGILVSPIQKIPIMFMNVEDQSLIKVLETL